MRQSNQLGALVGRAACLLAATFLTLAGLIAIADATDYETLLKRIPQSANSIVVLNVENIFNSAVAETENWRQNYADRYAAAPLIVPPRSRRFSLAADFDLESMKPRWQVASIEMTRDLSIADIEKVTAGNVDRLHQFDGIWTSPQACVLKFAPREFGVMFPTDRQLASVWARRAATPSHAPLTEYLRNAVSHAEKNDSEIILALELVDVVHPQKIRAAVQKSPTLAKLKQEELVPLLASIQGVVMGVRVRDRVYGSLRVDFAKESAILEPVAKEIILTVLANHGAMIDDLNAWEARTSGKHITLAGDLSTAGMRQLFSLVSLDTTIVGSGQESDASETPSEEERMAKTTVRYFRSVTKHLEDLEKPRKSGTLSQVTLWLDTYARKIDRLPTAHVDPEMVAYGQYVAQSFRYMVETIQRAQAGSISAADLPAPTYKVGALPTSNVVNYGGYRVREYVPYVTAEVNANDVRKLEQQHQQKLADAEKEAQSMLERLDVDTETIRSQMASKYQVKF